MSPDTERRVVDAVQQDLFVSGAWRPSDTGRRFAVEDPSTGAALCEVADATPVDGMAALAAAAEAQVGWGRTAPRVRSRILYRTYELLVERTDDLALLMTLEMGKPLAESRGEVVYAAEFFNWFSQEAVRIEGSYLPAPGGGSRILTMRQPVGPALFITPWNFPLAMGARKIAPAVAAGCTMVAKPAAQTPLCMLALGAIMAEAGLPDGVLNVVPTSDAGALVAPLLADQRLRKLSFTGSTAVGRALYARAAEQVLSVSMELGGNAPFLVFDDADISAAVDGAMLAKLRNMGEACTAANRFLVAEPVAAEFTERLADRMRQLRVGRGVDDDVQVGPLIDGAAVRKVSELVADALGHGAHLVLPGGPVDGGGHFYRPAVLTDVPPDVRIGREEIFGPVAAISTFTDPEQALTMANDTEYGLVSYVYTRDLDRAVRMAERLEYGMVGLNSGLVSNPAAPFGGVKHSGIGREGGRIGIDEYCETKYVALNVPSVL